MRPDADLPPRETRRERRRASRAPVENLPPSVHARLRAGHDVRIVNLSRFGILLESSSRLLPGHRCTLRISGPTGNLAIPGRILRAEVARLDRRAGVIYRGAVEFEDPKTLKWVDDTPHG